MTILKLCHESYQSQRSVRESVNVTLTISLVLSSENLTPRRTPAITMAVTTAHVTAMITCFRVTRDFLSSPASRLGSTCTTLKITNINNSGLDKDICIKFYGKMHRGHAEMTMWPKVWNRKLIRVTSWSECQKHKCVDLGDYNIYLSQIWYRAQLIKLHKYHSINTPE